MDPAGAVVNPQYIVPHRAMQGSAPVQCAGDPRAWLLVMVDSSCYCKGRGSLCAKNAQDKTSRAGDPSLGVGEDVPLTMQRSYKGANWALTTFPSHN